jgi:magnesium transporter
LLSSYPGEAARRLEKLPVEEIDRILRAHPPSLTVRVWEQLAPDVAVRLLNTVEAKTATAALNRMDPNHAAMLLAGLDEEGREAHLKRLTTAVANDIRSILAYPADSAGSLMDTRVITFRPEMTVRQALSRLRMSKRKGVRVLFVVDDDRHLLGVVSIQDLAVAAAGARLDAMMRAAPTSVEAITPREEVVERLEQHPLTDLPVLDFEGRLMGVIRYQVLVNAVEDEASVKMQTMVGASKDERALSKISFAVRKRLPWLQINLATAFLAAAVVGLFEGTIAKFTALAVLLPVVAGQSGNTGAQALAVTMRGLALREIRPSQWARVVFKEINVGLWNGIAVALVTSLGVYIWSRSTGLALVIGVSMVLSMIIAGMFGAAIPIILTVLRQDPAQSSSIFLTTVTDVAGFFSFLGIATLLSGML